MTMYHHQAVGKSKSSSWYLTCIRQVSPNESIWNDQVLFSVPRNPALGGLPKTIPHSALSTYTSPPTPSSLSPPSQPHPPTYPRSIEDPPASATAPAPARSPSKTRGTPILKYPAGASDTTCALRPTYPSPNLHSRLRALRKLGRRCGRAVGRNSTRSSFSDAVLLLS